MTVVCSSASVDSAVPPVRRGECPTLAKPMRTGDGLLARMRPIGNALTTGEMRALAAAASRYGNGIVEVTARGSLQVRGLRPETVGDFEAAVLASGIRPETGTSVETSPLSGLDPSEVADLRPMAQSLRRRIAEHARPLRLAAKLAIILDGGGHAHLGGISADIRATAFVTGTETKFLLAIGGTEGTARPVAVLGADRVEDAIVSLLEAFSAAGTTVRGKTLDLSQLGALYDPSASLVGPSRPPALLLGVHDAISPDGDMLGVSLAYCQASGRELTRLCDTIEAAGAHQVRLAPDHGMFIFGLRHECAEDVKRTASELGFLVESNDPRRSIALCAGAAGCASAYYDTHALADRVLRVVPGLLDDSVTLHLSGCPKGCAHPSAASLTIAGATSGFGLVVNGAASDIPLAYLDERGIETAWKRLAALVGEERQSGESTGICLERLGAGRIEAAMQLEEK